jgi:hypothetical protein
MAEAACLVLVDRQVLVKQQQLPERSDLPLSIQRGLIHLAERVGLNPVEVCYDSLHLAVKRGRHPTPKVIR